jgi:transcriptional regulator with PAS, ATPase and Fis domain
VSQALRPESDAAPAPLLGEAPAFLDAVNVARRFAASDVPILLVGDTGTGKELFAQHIHWWSGRAGALVDVNCAAIPETLAESVLFGHRRGAFSGAVEGAVGLMEHADRGTLFLDELCSLPLPVQAKLLRVIETKSVRRVGETMARSADFRLVCAAQERLDGRVRAGTFRMDLLQRVGGVVVALPPLAARGRDVLLLAERFAAAGGRLLAPDAASRLARHSWPGNVRELAAVIERARWLTLDPIISGSAVEEALRLGADVLEAPQQRVAADTTAQLMIVCQAHDWNAERAAEALGVHRSTLYRRLRAVGISLRANKWLPRVERAVCGLVAPASAVQEDAP